MKMLFLQPSSCIHTFFSSSIWTDLYLITNLSILRLLLFRWDDRILSNFDARSNRFLLKIFEILFTFICIAIQSWLCLDIIVFRIHSINCHVISIMYLLICNFQCKDFLCIDIHIAICIFRDLSFLHLLILYETTICKLVSFIIYWGYENEIIIHTTIDINVQFVVLLGSMNNLVVYLRR